MKWHRQLAHDYMTYTEHAPKRQLFDVAPAIQEPTSAVNTPLPCIKRVLKGYSHSFITTRDKSAVTVLESREQRHIKAISHDHLSRGMQCSTVRFKCFFFRTSAFAFDVLCFLATLASRLQLYDHLDQGPIIPIRHASPLHSFSAAPLFRKRSTG